MSHIYGSYRLEPPEFRRAWRTAATKNLPAYITAIVRLGEDTEMSFDDPGEALELAGAALAAFQALMRLEADPDLEHVNPADLDITGIGQAAAAAITDAAAAAGARRGDQ